MTLDKLLLKLDAFDAFADTHDTLDSGIVLGNHQLLPIFDALENGLHRFLLAYGTGAGKTIIPLEILKHLKRTDKPHRTLVIAPYQTTMENWNEEVLAHSGLSMNIHKIEDKKSAEIPSQADFVLVNFEKLPRAAYLDNLLNYASESDLIIPDEFHNLKNHNGKVSKGFQKIVEASRDARLIGLTATPVPDRLRDLGIVLYAIDPDRYAHYKDHPFDPRYDREAIWELHESGKMRFFSREDVAAFFNLPQFTEHDPVRVEMIADQVQDYFDAYSTFFEMGGTLHALERISILSALSSQKTKAILQEKLQQGYTLNFFSHLRNPPKHGSKDQGIFYQTERMLTEIGAKHVVSIHGGVSKDDRLSIQADMEVGKVDALINQWNCSGEGFSEVAGDRPVFIVPLRSPFSPGTVEQIVGRSYRPGQHAPVEYQEFHAHSDELKAMIGDFVRKYARDNGRKIKSSWSPTLFSEDVHQIRRDKEKEIECLLYGRPSFGNSERYNINSVGGLARSISKGRIIDTVQDSETFGKGTMRALRYVGMPYDLGLRDNAEPLGKDYNRQNILIYPTGKINFFLAGYIEGLKKEQSAESKPWKIADLGCCSSAVFAQARLLWQALYHDISAFDEIHSIDGVLGFIENAKEFIREKTWCEEIPNLDIPGINEEILQKVHNVLTSKNYDEKLQFNVANFTEDPLGTHYDVIVISQVLQYNDQSNGRDIESIVMNVNKSLNIKGHYLTVMTGNSFTKSFTSKQDVENYQKILEAYGFEVVKTEHISGKRGNKTELKPFHFIHARKVRNHTHGYVSFDDPPLMYPMEFEVLTGGDKMKDISRQPPGRLKPSSAFPDGFYTPDNKPSEVQFENTTKK